jgi:hypothetical protein
MEPKKMKWRRKKKKEEGRTCGGFEAVLLAVADRRTAWTVVGLSSSSLRFFFCSVLLCFCFLPLFLTVLLSTGRTVAAGGDDDAVAERGADWPVVLLSFSAFPFCFFVSLLLCSSSCSLVYSLSLSGPLKCSLFYSFFPSATVFIPAVFFFFVSGFLK